MQYSLVITRETCESQSVEVEADNLDDAQEKVMEMLSNLQLSDGWEPDDYVGPVDFTNLGDYEED